MDSSYLIGIVAALGVLVFALATALIVVVRRSSRQGEERVSAVVRTLEATAIAAGRAATEGAKPLSQNGYKMKLVEIAVKRAVMLAGGLKPYWEA